VSTRWTNSGAQLRLDVVADDRDAAASNRAAHPGSLAMKTGMLLTRGHARFERAFGVEFGRLLTADRQVIEQHVGARLAQHLDHLRFRGLRRVGQEEGAVILHLIHVVGDAVEHAAHPHGRASRFHMIAEHRRAIGLGEDCLGDVAPTLRRSTSHAATILMSLGRYPPKSQCMSPICSLAPPF
jgi:hypothetical protein